MSLNPRLRDILDLKKYFSSSKDRKITSPTESDIRRFKEYLDSGYISNNDFKNAFFESISGLSNLNDLKDKWILFGRIFYFLGQQYANIKKRQKALECYEIIINEEFNLKKLGLFEIITSVRKFYTLALVYVGRYFEAIEGFKLYIQLIESNMSITYNDDNYYYNKQTALYYISLSYYYLGNLDIAEVYIDKMINGCRNTDRSNYYSGLNLKAAICSKKEEFYESIKYYEKILKYVQNDIKKDNFKNYLIGCLACNFADANDLKNALKKIKEITVKDPDSYLLDMFGYVYYKLHSFDESIKYFDNAINKITNNNVDDSQHELEIYFHRGNALLQQKKYQDARTCYELSLSIGESFKAYNNKAVTYAYEGDQNNAISELRNALQLDPTSPIVIENLAKAHSSTLSKKSFWDYWISSNPKKIILAIFMTGIIGLIFLTIFIPALMDTYNRFSGDKEIQGNISAGSNMSQINTINMVKNLTSIEGLNQISQKSNISTNNLILISMMVLFLLSPMITNAKIGAGTLELTMSEIKAADLTLYVSE